MKFNTAVSALMILLNKFEEQEEITKDDYRTFLILLNPIAPHITEELNEKYALGEAICKSSWPKYDIAKTVDQEKEIAVQVNGKVRATITININEDEESIKEKALTAENVKNHTAGKEIVKVIIIKGKIVNIVVKQKCVISRISFFQQFLWIKKFIIVIGDAMKVKLFDLEDEKDLEEAINDFLEDMKGELWDIKYQVSSSIYGEEQVYCFSAMVIYY